jgi:hypothetical protein
MSDEFHNLPKLHLGKEPLPLPTTDVSILCIDPNFKGQAVQESSGTNTQVYIVESADRYGHSGKLANKVHGV